MKRAILNRIITVFGDYSVCAKIESKESKYRTQVRSPQEYLTTVIL